MKVHPLTPDEVFVPPPETAICEAVARVNALLLERVKLAVNGDSPEVAPSEISDDPRVRTEVLLRFETAGWYISWTGAYGGPLKFGRRTMEHGPPTRPQRPQASPPPPPPK